MIPEQTTLDLGLGYRDLSQPKRANPKALARRNDPATSKAAAKQIAPSLSRLQRRTLDVIREHPGRTSQELARAVGDRDIRTLNRRISELKKSGRIVARTENDDGTKTKCSITGCSAARYWAVEA